VTTQRLTHVRAYDAIQTPEATIPSWHASPMRRVLV
jgi:hypothetical protein